MTEEVEDEGVDIPSLYSGTEHAMAVYTSPVAEHAQAFGNLLVQSYLIPPDDPRFPLVIDMLGRLINQVDPAPRGSRTRLRAVD